jgi:hypothetical protein
MSTQILLVGDLFLLVQMFKLEGNQLTNWSLQLFLTVHIKDQHMQLSI